MLSYFIDFVSIIAIFSYMKHNRRTPAEDQKNLSSEAKLENILKFGDFNELISCVKNNTKLAHEVFETRTKKDLLIQEKRKKFLSNLFRLALT